MIVTNVRATRAHDRRQIRAEVVWEDVDRDPYPLFFEVFGEHEDWINVEPDAFLITTILPAWHASERRLRIDAPTCPLLTAQIQAPLRTLSSWYPELGPPPQIETPSGRTARPRADGQALSFLSCGVDSLMTLRANELFIPKDHPLSIRACVLVDWASKERNDPDQWTPVEDQGKVKQCLAVTDALDADLVELRTNLWHLDDDGYFFTDKAFGAYYSGIAQLLSATFSTGYVGASMDAAAPFPVGSHPLLDPYYSSSAMRIDHFGTYMNRLERTRMVADWDVGLANLRVCQNENVTHANCGKCEKCIRVQTTLVAFGKLHLCRAFARDDVDRALLDTVIEYRMIGSPWVEQYWVDILPVLQTTGRTDLVEGVEAILADYRRRMLN